MIRWILISAGIWRRLTLTSEIFRCLFGESRDFAGEFTFLQVLDQFHEIDLIRPSAEASHQLIRLEHLPLRLAFALGVRNDGLAHLHETRQDTQCLTDPESVSGL